MSEPSQPKRGPRPVPPVEPEAWQCCGSGCDPCVYDRYWEELARFEAALAAWEADEEAGGPPENDASEAGEPPG